MSRTRKTTKRTASRCHHAITSSRRSSLRATAQPASPTSALPAQTRADAPVSATPASIPPIPRLLVAPQPTRIGRNRAHPDQAVLNERAFALSCIGLRSPATAAQLGVSERTSRHWNYTTLRTLALDAICGPEEDDDSEDETAAGAPTQNASSFSAATSPTKTANDSGNDSGNKIGNTFGNISGNGASHTLLGADSKLGPNTAW